MSWKAASLALALLLVAGCAAKPPPELTEAAKSLAIDGIKQYPEVENAVVAQEGKQLSLVVMVVPGTSEARAKELGDSFLRMVKAHGPGPEPGEKIGKGVFDYLVSVITWDEALYVMGAKLSSSEHITWY